MTLFLTPSALVLPAVLLAGYLVLAFWRPAALGWLLLGGAVSSGVLWIAHLAGLLFTPWGLDPSPSPSGWADLVGFSEVNAVTGLVAVMGLLVVTLLAHLVVSVTERERIS